jgi:hypothetical protein
VADNSINGDERNIRINHRTRNRGKKMKHRTTQKPQTMIETRRPGMASMPIFINATHHIKIFKFSK